MPNFNLQDISDIRDLNNFIIDFIDLSEMNPDLVKEEPNFLNKLIKNIFLQPDEFKRIFVFRNDFFRFLNLLPADVSENALTRLLNNKELLQHVLGFTPNFTQVMQNLSLPNQRRLMDLLLENEDLFDYFLKSTFDVSAAIAHLPPVYSQQLKDVIFNDPARYQHFIANVTNFNELLFVLPTHEDELLDRFFNPDEFHRLIPSMHEFGPACHTFAPKHARLVVDYVFNNPIEYKRIVKDVDAFSQGLRSLPKEYANLLLQRGLEINEFRRLIVDVHDLIRILKLLPREMAQTLLLFALKNDFKRLFGDKQMSRNAVNAFFFMPIYHTERQLFNTAFDLYYQWDFVKAFGDAADNKEYQSIELIQAVLANSLEDNTISPDHLRHLVISLKKELEYAKKIPANNDSPAWINNLQNLFDFCSAAVQKLSSKHLPEKSLFQPVDAHSSKHSTHSVKRKK